MKLVSYYDPTAADGALKPGVLVGDDVVDVASLSLEGTLASVKDIVAIGSAGLRKILGSAADKAAAAGHGTPVGELRLGPPIADPSKILCVGLNYNDHVEEAKANNSPLGTGAPVVFAKFPNALIGHREDIVVPPEAIDVDWEGELVVVIGTEAKRVSEADALKHVAGYMTGNDVTSRFLQVASPQWTMGKAFDTSGPVGPVLVTADEIPDPQALDLTTTLNGKVVQSTNTSLMIHTVAKLISYISSAITLSPGDMIFTGTPSGVGAGMKPMVFMNDGDEISVSISGVGDLTNTVRDEK